MNTIAVRCLDQLFVRVTDVVPLRLLVWPVRIALALAFIPAGTTKVLNRPFTRLPVTDPVGAFFAHLQAMPQVYWLIGATQIVAALLILVPWTSVIGALMYFPLAVGIVVVTWTIPFAYTPVITAGMLLGSVFLLCWEWPRLRYLALPRDTAATRSGARSIGK